MPAGSMTHEELSTVAAASGDMHLLAQCVAVSALDLVHEMQNAPASMPARAAAFISSITNPASDQVSELTPTEGNR